MIIIIYGINYGIKKNESCDKKNVDKFDYIK